METAAVSFSAQTDVGRKREHNEDNFLVDQKLGLFVVCDGMGGHAAGEVASAIAVRTIHDEIKNEAELLHDYRAGTKGAARVSKRDILNMLEFAANRASSRVHSAATQDAGKRGMGTTVVCVLFVGSQAFVAHVGDSRAYLLRGNKLEQLTDDHNVYNELIKRKKLTREQITQLAPKNAITRAVGVYESCEPESMVLDVLAGDKFLLCTDGLSEYFEEPEGSLEELGKVLRVQSTEESVRSLIETANSRGGKDNITAVVVSVDGGSPEDLARAQQLERRRQVLGQVSLFEPLDDRELRRVLQVTEIRKHDNGETIVREGERGDELFIVLNGELSVLRGGTVVRTLKAGEHVGEMALIRSQPRSASVVSRGPAELLVMRRPEFFGILRSQPRLAVKLLWQLTGVLADRLADTTRDLDKVKHESLSDAGAIDITDELFPEEEEVAVVVIPSPPSQRPKPS